MNQRGKILFGLFFLSGINLFAQSEEINAATNSAKEEVTQIGVDAPKEERKVYSIADEMPRFPGCEEIVDEEDRTQCANRKLVEFAFEHLRYPIEASEMGEEGIVFLQFVVEPDGSLTNGKVVREFGYGSGRAAMELLGKMPNFIPGKIAGEAVAVEFATRVWFNLERVKLREVIEDVDRKKKKKKNKKKKRKKNRKGEEGDFYWFE